MFTAFIKILPVGELPAHNHTASTNTTGNHTHKYGGTSIYCDAYQRQDLPTSADKKSWFTSEEGNHSHTVIINNTGSGTAHNNLQPYVSCYIWKRVN